MAIILKAYKIIPSLLQYLSQRGFEYAVVGSKVIALKVEGCKGVNIAKKWSSHGEGILPANLPCLVSTYQTENDEKQETNDISTAPL